MSGARPVHVPGDLSPPRSSSSRMVRYLVWNSSASGAMSSTSNADRSASVPTISPRSTKLTHRVNSVSNRNAAGRSRTTRRRTCECVHFVRIRVRRHTQPAVLSVPLSQVPLSQVPLSQVPFGAFGGGDARRQDGAGPAGAIWTRGPTRAGERPGAPACGRAPLCRVTAARQLRNNDRTPDHERSNAVRPCSLGAHPTSMRKHFEAPASVARPCRKIRTSRPNISRASMVGAGSGAD